MKEDMRRRSPAGQQQIRLKAVRFVNAMQTQSEVARRLGVARFSVNKWVQRYREGGEEALVGQRRGRPAVSLVSARAGDRVLEVFLSGPERYGLRWPLWTWEAVQALLRARLELEVTRWTVLRYFDEWGLPLASAQERMRAWVNAHREEHDRLRVEARRAGASIFWLDEAEVWPDSTRKGELMCAIGGRGDVAFLVRASTRRAENDRGFVERLSRHAGGPLHLVAASRGSYWDRQARLRQHDHKCGRWPARLVAVAAHEGNANRARISP
jgi:transposase